MDLRKESINLFKEEKMTMKTVVTLCVFHEEKKPSLSIIQKDNEYYCFGCDAEGLISESPKVQEALEKEKLFRSLLVHPLIKEVRGILGLGLKEAKELVEGSPCWLKKEVKKEEAEKMLEKLKEFGGECRLA